MPLQLSDLKCVRCGACCRGYVPVTEDDLSRWILESRTDILHHVLPHEMIIGPLPRDEDARCPFLVSLPDLGITLCSIYKTRPEACASFPSSIEQAARVGCQGLASAAADHKASLS
jgi:Fe-S-cluster containining protein